MKMTFNRRQPAMEDDIKILDKWKMTSKYQINGRQPKNIR
jgi:hypothetical protein